MIKRIIQCIQIGLLCSLLTACAYHMGDRAAQIQHPLSSAPNLYPKPAQDYWQLAQTTEGSQRYTYLLQTAGRLLQDGQTQQAAILLQRIPNTELNVEQLNQKYILNALYALARHQPRNAITYLHQLPNPNLLNTDERILYHLSLARAYTNNGSYLASVQQHRFLEPLLTNSTLRTTNLIELWKNLDALDLSTLNQLRLNNRDDPELAGWSSLAYLTEQQKDDPRALWNSLQQWRQHYPQHPAQTLFATSNDPEQTWQPPQKIALLLPLTGPLAGPGNAVRDGFMASYFRAKRNLQQPPELIILDTNQQSMATLYNNARAQGAQMIIGPLNKRHVDELIQHAEGDIPILALNSINARTPNFIWQFSLVPQAEASAVARRAWLNNHRNALIITPDNSWGEAIADAFRAQWKLLGGDIVGDLRYANNQPNFDKSIQRLLNIDQSNARYLAVKTILGEEKLKFTPRRRRDADMIFIVAYPSQALQIIPLLKFYYAGNLSLYGLSLSYGGTTDPSVNRDLNNLIFPDMPWVFNAGNAQQKRWQASHTPWPDNFNRYNRLYALGYDAFALSLRQGILRDFPAYIWQGKTGRLTLDPTQHIQRDLPWARVQRGVAKSLPRYV